jgi:hypothetical protein
MCIYRDAFGGAIETILPGTSLEIVNSFKFSTCSSTNIFVANIVMRELQIVFGPAHWSTNISKVKDGNAKRAHAITDLSSMSIAPRKRLSTSAYFRWLSHCRRFFDGAAGPRRSRTCARGLGEAASSVRHSMTTYGCRHPIPSNVPNCQSRREPEGGACRPNFKNSS